MKITVEIKNVYGKELVYPICDTAHHLADLSNASTLTPKAIRLIKQLGYEIEVKQSGKQFL